MFLVLQESDAPPTMIKILPNCSWEEFDKAATKALKLPVGDEIQYQYFLGMLPVLLYMFCELKFLQQTKMVATSQSSQLKYLKPETKSLLAKSTKNKALYIC